ncbi:hypothetical protein, partial [Rhizobium sp. 12,4]|uniref:hypothetical protein n=1 Tax=Rhizobium sp. 12,4 TaxID=3405135 RepID=UPI003D32610B
FIYRAMAIGSSRRLVTKSFKMRAKLSDRSQEKFFGCFSTNCVSRTADWLNKSVSPIRQSRLAFRMLCLISVIDGGSGIIVLRQWRRTN